MSAGLYIHIPFCRRRCAYCDFVSGTDYSVLPSYLEALDREIEMCAGAFSGFDTVFIGGGTPSSLPPASISHLMDKLRASFSISDDAEISMESNPGTLDAQKLRIYRSAGINRLSIGMQSGDDALLRRIGRIHTFAEFLEAFHLARDCGFSNINVDVMYGLPGQRTAQHEDTLGKLCNLAPEHISAYSLILKENTPLFQLHDDLPDDDECYAMHVLTREFLKNAGYVRYEISNYARKGFECRHNLHYWNDEPYLGIGLNAHSAWMLDGAWTRFANTSDLHTYIEKLNRGESAVSIREKITGADEMFEYIMLGLRKLQGISRAAFYRRFGQSVDSVYPEALRALREKEYIGEDREYLRLNERGLDMQNQALLLFMGD